MYNVKAKYLSIFLLAFATISSVSASSSSNDFVSNYLSHPYFFGEFGYGAAVNGDSNTSFPVGSILPPNYGFYENYSSQMNSPTIYSIGAGIKLPQLIHFNFISGNSLEASLSYNTYKVQGNKNEVYVFDTTTTTNSASFDYKVNNLLFLLNYVIDFKGYKNIIPFVTAGIGANRYSAGNFNELVSANSDIALVDSESFANHTDINFAYDIGLGAKIPLKSNLNLALAYRYLNAGTVETGPGQGVDNTTNTTYSYKPLSNENQFNEFYIRLTYQFI